MMLGTKRHHNHIFSPCRVLLQRAQNQRAEVWQDRALFDKRMGRPDDDKEH